MQIKYSPCKSERNTSITFIDNNTIKIDDVVYEFDKDSIVWDTIAEQTNNAILEAYRDESGELYVTVLRFYSNTCFDWDTGDYQEVQFDT